MIITQIGNLHQKIRYFMGFRRLLILILCLFISGLTFGQVIRGAYYNLPSTGYGTDTIISYRARNANTAGEAGFIAISGTDTVYFKIDATGQGVLVSSTDTILFEDITETVEAIFWTDTVSTIQTQAQTNADVIFWTDTVSTIQTQWGTSDTLDYYLDSVSTAAKAWTFGGNIDVTDTLTATAVEATTVNFTFTEYNPPHGYMNFSDSAYVLPLTQNAWETVTNSVSEIYIAQEEHDIEVIEDKIKLEKTGHYIVQFQISFKGSSNDDYELRIIHQGTQMYRGYVSTQNSADEASISIMAYIEAAALDKVWFEMRNSASQDDPTLVSSEAIIWLIHW